MLTPKSATGKIICGVIDITNPDLEQRYAYYAVVGRQTPNILRVRLSDLSEQGVETVENMKSLRMAPSARPGITRTSLRSQATSQRSRN